MDKQERAINVLIDVNKYHNKEIPDYELIKSVCSYFDFIKSQDLSQADLQFLKYLANTVGIPQYFDTLEKFCDDHLIQDINLNTFSSLLYESTLHTSEQTKLHKYQKYILEKFKIGQLNRFFLSASTSFGKTHIVYEIIQKMGYKNIVLIFPTIALLSENLEKIINNKNYEHLESTYSIHTLSKINLDEMGEKNIFIYTPERFLSVIEKPESNFDFDFVFIDEFYKIDNDYIIDEEAKENERDMSYRIAAFYALLKDKDVLLAGPYIESYNASFTRFLKENKFEIINYNRYEIVNKSHHSIGTRGLVEIDENLKFNFQELGENKNLKFHKLKKIIEDINRVKENCIIYCATTSGAERGAKELLKLEFTQIDFTKFSGFLSHLEKEFDPEWILIKALKCGIGIHHGLIPKYIQKEIISLFNEGLIKVLFSTTTITEGVNTSAKNLIITSGKKGDKPLKKFDAKNISGRAGRFLQHYNGRVIIIDSAFSHILSGEDEEIKHKNYDINSPKNEVDLFYSKDEFLKDSERAKIQNIQSEQEKREIPDAILDQYKVISKSDKIELYDNISRLTASQKECLTNLITRINYEAVSIDFDGFQVVLDTLKSIVKNEEISRLINTKCRGGESKYSLLTSFVANYLKDGFKGLVKYKIESQSKNIDQAIRESSKFTYSTVKYQTVKYLGVFNTVYKFYISHHTKESLEDVKGIDRLLLKLEYNALTDNGRKASDYGAPSLVLSYYEDGMKSSIRDKFDAYEKEVFDNIEKILKVTKK